MTNLDPNAIPSLKDTVASEVLSICIEHLKQFSDSLDEKTLNGIFKNNTHAGAYKQAFLDAIKIIDIALKGSEKRLNEHYRSHR